MSRPSKKCRKAYRQNLTTNGHLQAKNNNRNSYCEENRELIKAYICQINKKLEQRDTARKAALIIRELLTKS